MPWSVFVFLVFFVAMPWSVLRLLWRLGDRFDPHLKPHTTVAELLNVRGRGGDNQTE